MLRILLTGRLVFTPRPEARAVEFPGEGHFARLFAGSIDLEPVEGFQRRWRPQAALNGFGAAGFIVESNGPLER